MSTIIGGVTVATPDNPGTRAVVFNGRYGTAIDGTSLVDGTGAKLKWSLNWTELTAAQFSTLYTQLIDSAAQSFTAPEGGTYTVLVLQNTINVEYEALNDGSLIYTVTVDIQEQ